MYSSVQLARKYLQYYLSALNGKGHGMHSPFIFDFILNVLNNRQQYATPAHLQLLRKQLLRDRRLLHITDLGAGSRIAGSKERSVAQLAATAVKPAKYSNLLYRLVRHYQPQTVVELGTSLGLTTAYLAAANATSKIYTIEGSEAVHSLAKENFSNLQLANVEALQGNFDQVLPQLLLNLNSVDFAFLDGNHRYQPTLDYFHRLLPKADTHSIFVFDDIHWSAEMEQAWMDIKHHPLVRCSVDLFFLGFVFFRNEFREPPHFTIRF